MTEKEASAIESSSAVLYDDSKFKFQNSSGVDSGSGSGSRNNMRSASPPFDTSNTTSENISNNLKHKSTYAPQAVDQGSGGGDSGENGGTGSGHGTSGGVSAAGANTHHKRIHAHTYGRHSGTGSGNNSGISDDVSNSGNKNGADHYKPPLLTEQLLSAHNRGMEKKMIDSYKEGKKGDLKFLKNRLRSAKAAYQQAMKRSHHQSWNMAHHRVLHKELHGGRHGGGVPGAGGPSTLNIHDQHIDPIPLWPPFSVANSGLPAQVKPSSGVAGAGNPQSTVLSSSHQHHRAGHGLQPPHHSNRLQPEREQPNQLSTQAMYSNLIPALFFPAQMANNQKPTGGYIAVSMPTSFNQQPFQLLQVRFFREINFTKKIS